MPLRLTSADDTAADFTMAYANGIHGTARNHVFSIGYNVSGSGTRLDPTEPANYITFESNWDAGYGRLQEFHHQGVHTDGTTFRTYSVAIDRATKFVDVSLGVSKFTLHRIGASPTIYFQTSGTDVSWDVGITLTKVDNGVPFIRQKNAAGTNVVRLIDLDPNDYVRIGGDGNPTWLGGRLLFPGGDAGDIGEPTEHRPRNIYAVGGVATKTTDHPPTDADFVNPVDGMLAVDTTHQALYARVGGMWKGVALT